MIDRRRVMGNDPFNGHEYVDLDLPSGTLWATMNVGESSVNPYGNYYKYGRGQIPYSYDTSASNYYEGIEDPLDLYNDTARKLWGGDWHVPTKEQFQELIDNTTYTQQRVYAKNKYIYSLKFTASNGNYITLLPAGVGQNSTTISGTGFSFGYWTSSPYFNNPSFAWSFSASNNMEGYEGLEQDPTITLHNRSFGLVIRPVVG